MASKVTFKVSWDNDTEKKSGLVVHQISCGDAEDIPVPLYMAILKAMLQVEDILNGPPQKDEVKPIKVKGPVEPPTLPPPTPKTVVARKGNKFKRYTVEEKTEIAVMYSDGLSIAAIAEKFDRTPASIQKLISSMGVKRGDNVLNQEQDNKSDQPKEKKASVLKKPWYLQSQRPIPGKKDK